MGAGLGRAPVPSPPGSSRPGCALPLPKLAPRGGWLQWGGRGGGVSLHPSEHRLLLGVNAPPPSTGCYWGALQPPEHRLCDPPLHRRVKVRREGRDPRPPPALSGCTLPVSLHCTKVSFGQSTVAGAAPNVRKNHVVVHVTHMEGTKASWLIGDVKAGPAADVQVRAAVGKGQNTVKPCLLRT